MSDVFYLRPIDPPLAPEAVQGMVEYAGGCFDLHRVDWKHSFLSVDGARMLCWYRAPDAESARIALRELGSNMNAVWPGTVLGEGPQAPPISATNFVAEVLFDPPLSPGEIALRISALDRGAVSLVRGFFAHGGARWVGAFEAQDEHAVRRALECADLCVQAIWPCTAVTPLRRS